MTATTTERSMSLGASRRAAAQRQRARRNRRRVAWAAAATMAVAGLVGLVLIVAGGGEDAAGSGAVIELSLGDYFIGGDLTVPAGRVQLEATNVGREPHDVGIVGGKISTTLFSGQTATLDLGELAPGTYQLYCDVSDHHDRGMVATLTVTA